MGTVDECDGTTGMVSKEPIGKHSKVLPVVSVHAIRFNDACMLAAEVVDVATV